MITKELIRRVLFWMIKMALKTKPQTNYNWNNGWYSASSNSYELTLKGFSKEDARLLSWLFDEKNEIEPPKEMR